MLRRSGFGLALCKPCALLVGLAIGTAALADVPAVPFVEQLARGTRDHPLADESGRIPLLVVLPKGSDASMFGLLPVAPGFGTIRLFPDEVEGFVLAHPGLDARVAPPRHLLLDRSTVWTRAEAARTASGLSGEGVVVGIIDTGLDVSHPDFRLPNGKTRVAWLLRQGVPLGKHPELEREFNCTAPGGSGCAVLDANDIDELLEKGGAALPRDLHGHGTHVTSIAAGNGGVMLPGPPRKLGGACERDRKVQDRLSACDEGLCTTDERGSYCTTSCNLGKKCPKSMHCQLSSKQCVVDTPRYVGVAPQATLVIAAPSASEGGFFDADVLNAARFVFDRATALGKPAVVNISIGSDFGPHDGSSGLERGLSEFVGDDKPGRAVVIAAGNSGALYRIGSDSPIGVHTEAHVTPYSTTRVPLYTPRVNSGTGFVWITFRPGDEVSVGFEGADGTRWIGLTDPGDKDGYKSDAIDSGVYNNYIGEGSPIESGTNSAVVVWQGAWDADAQFSVLLEGHGDAELWVTGQGDAGIGDTIGLQFLRATQEGTINVPASAPALIAVGCTINRHSWPSIGGGVELSEFGPDKPVVDDSTCYFSSAGPTPLGVPKPEISAPGGFVVGAMSGDADPRTHKGGLFDAGCPKGEPYCFVADDRHAVTAGTSMSAPQVTGGIALLLERDPTLTQARLVDVLQAGARWPSGHVPHDYQLGPGELDVAGALAALDEHEATFAPPDPAHSWYVLSSAYARPDTTWPVWGTIELRRSDGSIATGIHGSKLSIALDNAVVVQPLTGIRKGLFRFAFAAAEGTTGQRVHVEVKYDGVSLGTRSLPIGMDTWTAKGGVDAVGGGCSCETGPGGTPERGPAAWFGAALAALTALRGPARRRSSRSPMGCQRFPGADRGERPRSRCLDPASARGRARRG